MVNNLLCEWANIALLAAEAQCCVVPEETLLVCVIEIIRLVFGVGLRILDGDKVAVHYVDEAVYEERTRGNVPVRGARREWTAER